MFQLGAGPWSPEDLIQKALDSTTASGAALIPQLVDPYIPELALQYSPFRQLIPRTPWKSGTFDKNRRTALGRARMVGDGTSAPESQSTYARFQEPLKIMQGKGGVTGFMQAASQELVDALHLYLELVIASGITLPELVDAYMCKGETNVSRIKGGY